MKRMKQLIDGFMSFSPSRWWQRVWRDSVVEKHVWLMFLERLNLLLTMIDMSLFNWECVWRYCLLSYWPNNRFVSAVFHLVQSISMKPHCLLSSVFVSDGWNSDQLKSWGRLCRSFLQQSLPVIASLILENLFKIFRIFSCRFVLDGCESRWPNLQRPLVAAS